MKLTIGYKASAEQFGPRDLVEYAIRAEEVGLDTATVSDHFLPWRHNGGHAPFALAWLAAVGERTSRIRLGTSVLTPTFRYNPAVIAQAFATLGVLYPDRVFLGVGTGEALNEIAVSRREWPEFKERFGRLREAVDLIRELWTADSVDREGGHYELVGRADLRPPRAAGADLRRLRRTGDGQVRRPGRRRPDLHLGQGHGALRRAADARARRGRDQRPAGRRPTSTG